MGFQGFWHLESCAQVGECGCCSGSSRLLPFLLLFLENTTAALMRIRKLFWGYRKNKKFSIFFLVLVSLSFPLREDCTISHTPSIINLQTVKTENTSKLVTVPFSSLAPGAKTNVS